MPTESATLSVTETANQPTLAENLSLMEEQLTRLESEADDYAGTGNYPEWWIQEAVSSQLIRKAIKEPESDPSAVSQYFALTQKQRRIHATITGYDFEVSELSSIRFELGAEVVARGFKAEQVDGAMHTALAARLDSEAKKGGYVVPELEFLRDNYGNETVTGLLGLNTDDEYLKILRPLIFNSNTIKWMRFADEKKPNFGDSFEVYRTNYREWMSGALSSAVGLSISESNNFVFAASRRGEDESFMTILERFDYFGVDRLRDLSTHTGIRAFEDYSVSQLELMENLFQNPHETARSLSGHDVNVVMINRVGDYSGVMRNAAADYEDGNGRTLYFEIESLGDIYRNMSILHKLGVRPSTLVLAAHSAPGQFVVSDIREPDLKRHDIATIAGRNLVRLANENDEKANGETGYSMHGMKGFARMVEKYMQPSRAIDDDDTDRGRKKIIFQACYTGKEVEVKDVNDEGVKFVMGLDSVVSRLGNDLVANDVGSEVDIYGAPSGIQIHKTKKGIRYSGQPESFGEERTQLHAVRVHVQNRQVSQQNVDEIIMHKAA